MEKKTRPKYEVVIALEITTYINIYYIRLSSHLSLFFLLLIKITYFFTIIKKSRFKEL